MSMSAFRTNVVVLVVIIKFYVFSKLINILLFSCVCAGEMYTDWSWNAFKAWHYKVVH